MLRSGPTGTAQTIASALNRSPLAVTALAAPRPAVAAADRDPRPPARRSGSGGRAARRSSAPPSPTPRRPAGAPTRRSRRSRVRRRPPPCAGPTAARCARPIRPTATASPPRARARRSGSRLTIAASRRPRSSSSARRVGVRPRVVGVDRPRQRRERRLGARVGGAVGVVEPRRVVADVVAVGHHPRLGAGQVGERRHERQPELGDELDVGLVEAADDLAAELHDPAVGHPRLLDAATGSAAGLEHDHVGAAGDQIAGGVQPGQAAADDDHVGVHHAADPPAPAPAALAPVRALRRVAGTRRRPPPASCR